ncbi:hypothetical protein AVEN_197386-1 [Araneus ventricosus]|uniref:Uncharacterized protein n=1 Tax=Araneus ventricosus TaxID=182803 RepID=A0A4Y2JDB0_ARAVE|nr:hypothetical protein AVEN_197386-1 [Araneus ventricosus]
MAVWNVLKDWELEDKAHILCSDSTSSNTGRINGAITFLELYADREMTYFPCRHHIYELVLRSVFEYELNESVENKKSKIHVQFSASYYEAQYAPYFVLAYRSRKREDETLQLVLQPVSLAKILDSERNKSLRSRGGPGPAQGSQIL